MIVGEWLANTLRPHPFRGKLRLLDSLAPREGRYEVRITEELHEVSYLDQVRLMALDHPRELEIFTNDKFKSPPFPEFRLFGSRERRYPVRARDGGGRDVR